MHQDCLCCADRPINAPQTFQLVVHMRDEVYTIPAKENETLLTAWKSCIGCPQQMRAGGCGYCHSKWIKGKFFVAEGEMDAERQTSSLDLFIPVLLSYGRYGN